MSDLSADPPLLARFRQGDPAALREVYDAHALLVARYLRGGFGYEEDRTFAGFAAPLELADALQEVFSRAFSERARLAYDGVQPYAAYLAGIARNVAIDQLRRRTAASAAVGALRASHAPESVATPEFLAEEAEAAELVQAFVGGLTEAERAIFRARFTESLTQEAAAAALGMTRIQLRRAELHLRQRLLEHLKSRGYLEDVQVEGWGVRRSISGRGQQ